MEHWYCLNCLAVSPLDVHGRCGLCGSDAVVANHVETSVDAPAQKRHGITLYRSANLTIGVEW